MERTDLASALTKGCCTPEEISNLYGVPEDWVSEELEILRSQGSVMKLSGRYYLKSDIRKAFGSDERLFG